MLTGGKYIGRIVEIVYEDGKENVAKQRILIYGIRGSKVMVFDVEKQSFRTLRLQCILSAQLVRSRVNMD
ncbi:hypothetical protein [Cohnella lupini]|uniref:Uncharacterized protein n=1 Tax=Cohnella lupini TaxID=1294267 RepID=A0A3D9IVS8_9BACL|nr:hypothetical protein [Cohnella lupini]RED65953.1 hypothetical protein DFP95_101450 [Cohnella lupini]